VKRSRQQLDPNSVPNGRNFGKVWESRRERRQTLRRQWRGNPEISLIQTGLCFVTVRLPPNPIDVSWRWSNIEHSKMIYLTVYFSTLVVFVLCDIAWLVTMASRLYRPTLRDIMLTDVNLPAGIAFYLIYPVGLVIFAILPAFKSGSLAQATLGGALLGFFTYMTYDLTNQATLRNWTTQLTLVDAGWGTLLGAIAATAGFWLTTKLAV
jgi:uncharacterized membrane protein